MTDDPTRANGAGDQAPDLTAEPPPDTGSDSRTSRRRPSSRASGGDSPKPAPPPTRKPPLKRQLEETFATISLMIMAMGDEYCATVVASNAEALAEAYDRLAKVNPQVKAVLERMMEGSAWGAVITTTAATALPILFHHGLYPKRLPPPFTFGLGPQPPPSDEVKNAENDAGDSPT